MSLSRRAAKEHSDARKAEKASEGTPAAPYKHVPTHAAIDALSGAPPSWKYDDRSKIKAAHSKRSMRFSRAGSSLSTVSYADTGRPSLPRANSYGSYNAAWFDRGGEVYYLESERARDRPKPSRSHSYQDSGVGPSVGPSPLASNMQSEDVSPAESSGNSLHSRSSEHLEMSRPSAATRRHTDRPQPNVYSESDIFGRLHTSTTRKLGEAPLYDYPPEPVKAVAKTTVAPVTKPKKQRWSLMGKKNSAALAA
ncbi:hypothetical protein DH86_00001288 [Scytalidium sp. 3C]|nr:hypothetical protein DH86_00001288 [Scytalidium sp. 3C]